MCDIEQFPYYFGAIKNFIVIGRIYIGHDIYLIYIYFERHSRFWYERKSYLLSLTRITFELTGRACNGNSEQRLSSNRNEESMQIDRIGASEIHSTLVAHNILSHIERGLAKYNFK